MDRLNPYAAPQHDSTLNAAAIESGGIWRDGNLLVMRKGAMLPDRCVKCNAPAEGRRLKYVQLWHHPIYFLLAPVALIPILFFLHRATLSLGVCERHLRERNRAIATSVLSFVFGIASITIALAGERLPIAVQWRVLCFLIAGVALLAISIRANLASVLASPHKIDCDFVWLKKIAPGYLAQFPPVADDADSPPLC